MFVFARWDFPHPTHPGIKDCTCGACIRAATCGNLHRAPHFLSFLSVPLLSSPLICPPLSPPPLFFFCFFSCLLFSSHPFPPPYLGDQTYGPYMGPCMWDAAYGAYTWETTCGTLYFKTLHMGDYRWGLHMGSTLWGATYWNIHMRNHK